MITTPAPQSNWALTDKLLHNICEATQKLAERVEVVELKESVKIIELQKEILALKKEIESLKKPTTKKKG